MKSVESISSAQVYCQLRKLFKYSAFVESKILRRFLIFIVREKLADRGEHLKEYSIAIAVLKKPVNFSPRMDGVVRVHARRLRDVLHRYYESSGKYDTCRISIPKGRYVPIFQTVNSLQVVKKEDFFPEFHSNHSEEISILVMPLKTVDLDISKFIFVDHVRLALTADLATSPGIHVIYNPGIRQDFKSMKNDVFEPEYLVTGSVYFLSTRFRIAFNLVEASSRNVIWSEEFKFKLDLNENYKLTSTIRSRILFCLQNHAYASNQEKLNQAIL